MESKPVELELAPAQARSSASLALSVGHGQGVVMRTGARVIVEAHAVHKPKRPLSLRELGEPERLALWYLTICGLGGEVARQFHDPQASLGVILALLVAYWLRSQ